MGTTRPSGSHGTKGVQASWLVGGWAERPIGQTLMGLAVTLAAIPLTLQLIAKVLERPYTVYVDANSEVLRLTTPDLSLTPWYLDSARLLQQEEEHTQQDTSIQLQSQPIHNKPSPHTSDLINIDINPTAVGSAAFQGYIQIGPNTSIALTRHGAGPLIIDITGRAQETDTPSIPAIVLEPLDCADDSAFVIATAGHSPCKPGEAPDQTKSITNTLTLQQATLLVDIGEAPLNGTLNGMGRIGGDPYQPTTPSSPPLLKRGEVSIVGRRLISEQVYTLMQTKLHLGDTVNVHGHAQTGLQQTFRNEGTTSALFTCLFSVEGEALGGQGIELACHASGTSLDIGSYSDSSRRDIAPRPWDVLINEPSMQATLPLAITGLFVLVLRLLDGLYPRLCRWPGTVMTRIDKRRSNKP